MRGRDLRHDRITVRRSVTMSRLVHIVEVKKFKSLKITNDREG